MASSDPDLLLWRQVQKDDSTAFDQLMLRHQEMLFRFIFRYAPSTEDAQDILQETFVRAYLKRHQFKPKAKLTTWLFAIALNLCRDHARSRSTRQAHVTDSLVTQDEEEHPQEKDIPVNSIDPGQQAVTKEELKDLEAALQALPHDLKTALILFALEGHSQQHCAELLNVTPKVIENRVYRARKLLAEKLKHRKS